MIEDYDCKYLGENWPSLIEGYTGALGKPLDLILVTGYWCIVYKIRPRGYTLVVKVHPKKQYLSPNQSAKYSDQLKILPDTQVVILASF